MQEHDLTFVRTEMELAQKPPRSEAGFVALGRRRTCSQRSPTRS